MGDLLPEAIRVGASPWLRRTDPTVHVTPAHDRAELVVSVTARVAGRLAGWQSRFLRMWVARAPDPGKEIADLVERGFRSLARSIHPIHRKRPRRMAGK